jgi:hypothetical protein
MPSRRRPRVDSTMRARTTRLLRHLRIFLMCCAIAGCAVVPTRTGIKPNVEVLEGELRIGESTKDDVRYFLGKPFGQGRDLLPITREGRSMWIYYYAVDSIPRSRCLVLYIFFAGDRYDGYMWFSSLLS